MFERHKQEKSEGKTYSEAGISDEMRALNKRFGMLHGISSLLNLQAVLALGFHGLVSNSCQFLFVRLSNAFAVDR
jgi:hypothetical protein